MRNLLNPPAILHPQKQLRIATDLMEIVMTAVSAQLAGPLIYT